MPVSARSVSSVVAGALGQLLVTIRNARDYGDVGRFLVARFLYADAVQTIIVFMVVYARRVGHISGTSKTILLGLSIVFAVIGAFVAGAAVERVGPKRVLLTMLTLLVVTMIATAAVGGAATVWVAGPIVGVTLGPWPRATACSCSGSRLRRCAASSSGWPRSSASCRAAWARSCSGVGRCGSSPTSATSRARRRRAASRSACLRSPRSQACSCSGRARTLHVRGAVVEPHRDSWLPLRSRRSPRPRERRGRGASPGVGPDARSVAREGDRAAHRRPRAGNAPERCGASPNSRRQARGRDRLRRQRTLGARPPDLPAPSRRGGPRRRESTATRGRRPGGRKRAAACGTADALGGAARRREQPGRRVPRRRRDGAVASRRECSREPCAGARRSELERVLPRGTGLQPQSLRRVLDRRRVRARPARRRRGCDGEALPRARDGDPHDRRAACRRAAFAPRARPPAVALPRRGPLWDRARDGLERLLSRVRPLGRAGGVLTADPAGAAPRAARFPRPRDLRRPRGRRLGLVHDARHLGRPRRRRPRAVRPQQERRRARVRRAPRGGAEREARSRAARALLRRDRRVQASARAGRQPEAVACRERERT